MHNTNKGKKFTPVILTDAEIQRILRCCNPRYPTGCRNRALIATLYRSGVRITEALSLLPRDVAADAGTLRVVGKGGKFRVVGVDMGAIGLLSQWLGRRREEGVASGPVFCTLKGEPLSGSYVRQMLKRLAAKAGVDKRVYPHCFRHTFASQMLAEGANIGLISKQLGHASIATTAEYLDHIAPQEVVQWVSGREWGLARGGRQTKKTEGEG